MIITGALGWNDEACNAAVRQCEGNVTAAIEMLNREEVVMLEQFESAVKDMVRETVFPSFSLFISSLLSSFLFPSILLYHYLFDFFRSFSFLFIFNLYESL